MSGSPGPESERKLPRVLPGASSAAAVPDGGASIICGAVAIRISSIWGAQIFGLPQDQAALDDFLAIVP
jgi:hypothetical protein